MKQSNRVASKNRAYRLWGSFSVTLLTSRVAPKHFNSIISIWPGGATSIISTEQIVAARTPSGRRLFSRNQKRPIVMTQSFALQQTAAPQYCRDVVMHQILSPLLEILQRRDWLRAGAALKTGWATRAQNGATLKTR
jgi:hypothetical protein